MRALRAIYNWGHARPWLAEADQDAARSCCLVAAFAFGGLAVLAGKVRA